MTDTVEWNKYSEVKPSTAGVYLWRMDCKAVPDKKVIARAEYRKRGAGYVNVLSPEFDYWDGYRVIVPMGLEWAEDNESFPDISYEGLPELLKCPFCKQTPELKSSYSYLGGRAPYQLNTFSLKCCRWISKCSLSSPITLIEAWNKSLSDI